jgi:hypothetical protein
MCDLQAEFVSDILCRPAYHAMQPFAGIYHLCACLRRSLQMIYAEFDGWGGVWRFPNVICNTAVVTRR